VTHRHQSDIEAELDGLREYARQHPDMRLYIEPKREALRQELRAVLLSATSTAPAIKAVRFATFLPFVLVGAAALLGYALSYS